MGLGADILLKIRTMLDSKPIDEAKKKTEELGKTADKAGKESAGGMNVMAAATALMTGNVNGAIGAIAPLIEKVKVLKMSLTQLTLVGALISTAVMAFKSFRDAAEQAALRIAGIKMDNLTNEVNKSVEAYNKLKQSMQDTVAKGDAMLQHDQAMIDANKRLSLSFLDIAKQRELSNAKDEDERRVIENKYKGKVDEVNAKGDQDKANTAMQRSIEKENQLNDQIKAAEERAQEAARQAEDSLRQANRYSKTAKKSIGFGSFLTGGKGTFDAYSAEANKAMGVSDQSAKEYEEAQADIKKLREEIEAGKREREVLRTNMAAASREKTASSMATTREGSDIQTDIANKSARSAKQQEIEDMNRQKREADERFGVDKESAFRTRDREKKEMNMAAEVRESYRKKGDRKGFDAATADYLREKQEFEASEQRAQEIVKDAARTMKRFDTTLKTLEEQMKRIGQ